MRLTTEQVKKVAKLANLTLTPEEEEKYADQLTKILGHIEELNSVNTDSVEPTFNINASRNVLREDEALGNGLSQEDALLNAPIKEDAVPAGRQAGIFCNKRSF